MSKLILFNKPYSVLSQFTDSDGHHTLAEYISIKNVYAAGRLDKDSEGLLVLTDDGKLQDKIAHPRSKQSKQGAAVSTATSSEREAAATSLLQPNWPRR